MRFIPGFLMLLTVFVVRAIVLNAPLMIGGFLLRNRIGRTYIRAALALGFAAATAHFLYRMEWFDVWRHGVPPISYIVTAFGPYTVALGFVGWFIGGFIAPPTQRRLTRATND